MNFTDTFLKLTEYTIPFGYESKLEYLLPSGYKVDSIGNYYIEIGNSKTLFTTHLDTASDKYEKVNHIIDGNIIKTDGTTILGGDNKAGCLILLYLIEKGVEGTYYFFLGEEMAVHKNYPYGSLMAIDTHRDFFKKFERVIAFDRKETGQLVTRQLGYDCCSSEFADELISMYSSNGIELEKDRTGYYTDSAFFGDIVSEITNISCGVWGEHTKKEYVDIQYIESIAIASSKIDWDSLPVVREVDEYESDSRVDMDGDLGSDQELFKTLFFILDDMYYVCRGIKSYTNFVYHFKQGRVYTFTEWHGDDVLKISVDNGIIKVNDVSLDNVEEFKKYLGIENLNDNEGFSILLKFFKENNDKLSMAQFDKFIYQKGLDIEVIKKLFIENSYNLNFTGKDYKLEKSNLIKEYKNFYEVYKKSL